MSELTGRCSDELFIVGGGVANRLLCQLTANACGLRVHAGPEECTAAGNALIQAFALDELGGRDEIRQVMRNSFALTIYEPLDAVEWDEKLQRYKELKQVTESL
jgi:rhamnulokinase